jgi:hypothetical protein
MMVLLMLRADHAVGRVHEDFRAHRGFYTRRCCARPFPSAEP